MAKKLKDLGMFEGAGVLDVLSRSLARTAGATAADARDLNEVRVLLYSIRRRHGTAWTAGLPEDVARCLCGPATQARELTRSGGQAA